MKSQLLALLALTAVVLLSILAVRSRRDPATPSAPPASTTSPAADAAAIAAFTTLRAEVATVPVADPSAYADLNSPRTTVRDDLRIVEGLIENYLQSIKTPVAPALGFNDEITRALVGASPVGVAFLPATHPAIDAQGRLCDRWGTPYFFHPQSAVRIEVRSAGPDKTNFTADDVARETAATQVEATAP